jgi:cleavage stimulation factor subunit 3
MSLIIFTFLVIAPLPRGDHGCDTRIFDSVNSVQWITENEDPMTNNLSSSRKKRKMASGTIVQLDESDEEDFFSPPANDIYRLRQQKKVK